MSNNVVQKIHEAVPPELLGELQDFMFDKFLSLIEPMIDKKLGPKAQRVMSCGPYSNGGRIIIEDVASKIAQIGFTGMTIGSYYLPSDPKTRQELSDVIPQFLNTMKFFPTLQCCTTIPDYQAILIRVCLS
jgi:hypothetical protein